MARKKLFIPGPTEVVPEILEAMATPMIGHRSGEFKELYDRLQPKLQKLLYTQRPVFISTSSAWGVMEGALRNLVNKKVLNCMNGAFSDKWHGVSKDNGKEADPLQVAWGKPILPEAIDEKLASGEYDALTLIHNETSTGVMSPLEDIAEVMRKYPDVMFIVDTVSSMSGVPIKVDELGADVVLAGTQKAFCLPPGMAVFVVSERAMKKAQTVKNRGYYFDFITFMKSHEKSNTPTTPAISHMFALDRQLDRMFEEGLDNRFARHREMAGLCREWANDRFKMFPEEGYASITLSTVSNTRNVSIGDLNKWLGAEKGVVISNGYGDIKDKTFRISHMGDCTVAELKELLGWIDEYLAGS